MSKSKPEAKFCLACGRIEAPENLTCPDCSAETLSESVPIGEGRLLSWTIVHRPPEEFQSLAPYTIGIVEIQDGMSLLGRIEAATETLAHGLHLKYARIENGSPVFKR